MKTLNNDVHNMSDEYNFANALKSEDEIGRVIRTHLYIESLINDFLDIAVPKPEHLKPIKLDFYDKVQLALTLGLPDEFKKPLNFMGKIRNNFSHRLNVGIAENEVNNFFDTFSNEQKEEIINSASIEGLSWVSEGKSWKSIEPSIRFMIMCFALYYGLKIAILEFNYSKMT